jgi:ribosome biogenesis GTPase
MSGAGKSTLTNTLLGIEKQKTSEVRDKDSRGRHTTTHRTLIRLPGGACIIDTPGMRELKLTGEEKLTIGHFREIEVLSHECRFRDCRHLNEPGCAVRAALAAGTLDAERYAHYQKLLAERDHAAQAQVAGERKRVERVANKAFNRRLDEKYGSH